MYINGEESGTASISSTVFTGTTLFIGGNTFSGTTLRSGTLSVDEARIYGRAIDRDSSGNIDLSEVKYLYSNPSGNSGGLISANTVRTGVIQSSNFTSISGNFTVDGTYFDLDNGNLYSEEFGVVGGNAYFKGDITGANGTFSGSISATSGTIASWDINSSNLQKTITTDRFIRIKATSGQEGFELYRNDGDIGSGDVKVVNLGRIRTTNSLSYSTDYGFEILKRDPGTTTLRHVLRFGGQDAIIGGWNVDYTHL